MNRNNTEVQIEAINFEKSPRQRLAGNLRSRLSKSSDSQFKRNMGAGSVMASIGACVSVISYPLYLHYLGYDRYGLWLVLSVVVSVAQLGSLGIPWALMKLVAEEHGHSDWEGVRAYIIGGCSMILIAGLVLFFAVIALRHFVISWFKLEAASAAAVYDLLPYVAALSVLVLLFSTFNAALGGLGRMDLTSYNEIGAQVLIIIISAALLCVGLDLRAMAFGAIAGYFIAQLISFIQLQALMPVPLIARTYLSRHRLKQLLGTGGWVLSSGMFAGLLLPFTRLVLSRYAGLEAVTVNDICWNGSMRVRGVFDAAFRPLLPEVSNLHAKGNKILRARIRSIDHKAFLVIFAFALPMFIGLMIFTHPLLHLWLHHSYNSLLPATFRITLTGAFFSLLGSSAYYMLIGLGRARETAFSTALQFAVNALVLIIVVLRTRQITVAHAAIAFSIAMATSTLYLRIRIYLMQQLREPADDSLVSSV
jgi:O-antigen/teichoic acid export membrane protein